MTFFQAKAYLRYLRAAKGRHGTHSPFVYDFVEQVVQSRAYESPAKPIPGDNKYDALLARIATHYGYEGIVSLKNENAPCAPNHINVLPEGKPEAWLLILRDNINHWGQGGMIVAREIHADIQHEQQWEALIAEPAVRMSIDLYGMGLLLFRKEFLVKQHFVVKV